MNDTNLIYGIIYKITNKINGKVYIGQTTQKNGVYGRYQNGNILTYSQNQHLKNSILKYGIDNFEITESIDVAYNKDELDEKERNWIKFYKSFDKNYGYNKQMGGSAGLPTDETRKKMSDNNWMKNGGIPWNKGKVGVYSEKTIELMKRNHADFKGEKHPLYGIGHSEESKKKMSKTRKGTQVGEKNNFYGKKHSDSAKEKMRNFRLGKSLSEETKRKMSEKLSGANHSCAKKVICITTNKIFGCIKDAAFFYKINSSSIIKNCKGKAKYAGKLTCGTKLVWEYYTENKKKTTKNI